MKSTNLSRLFLACCLALTSCKWIINESNEAMDRLAKNIFEGAIEGIDSIISSPIPCRTEPVFPLSASDYPILKGYTAYSANALSDSLVPKVDKFFFMHRHVMDDKHLPLLWPYMLYYFTDEGSIYDASCIYSLSPSPIPTRASEWQVKDIERVDLQGHWLMAQSYDADLSFMSPTKLDFGFIAVNMMTHKQIRWSNEMDLITAMTDSIGRVPKLKEWNDFVAYYDAYTE